jgi:hypothetical protein
LKFGFDFMFWCWAWRCANPGVACTSTLPYRYITQDFAATQSDLEELTRSDRSSLRLTPNDQLVSPLKAKSNIKPAQEGEGADEVEYEMQRQPAAPPTRRKTERQKYPEFSDF